MSSQPNPVIAFIREFSLPLIAGVLAALLVANVAPAAYDSIVHLGPLDGLCTGPSAVCVDLSDHGPTAPGSDAHTTAAATPHDEAAPGSAEGGEDHGTVAPSDAGTEVSVYGFGLFGHHLTIHFLINDIFMLFFFGIAAKEIVVSLSPGGALNPPGKAVNPIAATFGGVLGPIVVYLLLTVLFVKSGLIQTDDADGVVSAIGQAFVPGASFADTHAASILRGWGVPTATDIALAWLAARVVFGTSHPAVNFLLLLAIADDGIGLVIIAIFYPSALHPVQPMFLLLVALGVAIAYAMRRAKVRSWVPYVAVGGLISWLGLLNAALHPALALVPIMAAMPGTTYGPDGEERPGALQGFEHSVKATVDFGLFFFGFANAGVQFAAITPVTWIVMLALIVGKLGGVTLFAATANALGFKYPTGMSIRHIVTAGAVAGMGLTVALFVAGEAFPGHSIHQGPAKMGALFSAFAAVLAIVLGKITNARVLDEPKA